MAWTNLTFAFGSVLTSAKMTQLDDNFDALAAGLSGAPKIQTAALEQTGGSEAVTQATIRASAVGVTEIGTGAVHQGELNTSTEIDSSAAGSTVVLAVTAGQYCFWPQVQVSSNNVRPWLVGVFGDRATTFGKTSGVYATWVTLDSTSVSFTLYSQFRYVAASPPYNMGNGDIPLFVWVLVDNTTGKALVVQTSKTPPWAYNGPTSITPSRRDKEGKTYKTLWMPDTAKNLNDSARRAAIISAGRLPARSRRQIAGEYIEVEIDHWLKNADMDLLPHPFVEMDLTGKTVVLLDPLSSVVSDLTESLDAGENINELIHEGFIDIGNNPLSINVPIGVTPVAANWK